MKKKLTRSLPKFWLVDADDYHEFDYYLRVDVEFRR
jgi:hypothetical protein